MLNIDALVAKRDLLADHGVNDVIIDIYNNGIRLAREDGLTKIMDIRAEIWLDDVEHGREPDHNVAMKVLSDIINNLETD